mmetsp:Transcript_14818/g.30159  ORF Transcript_14818/g.30159 Transcript_14818/m.30159 type:complete len:87 (-) Transcript_14818:351-611(-)
MSTEAPAWTRRFTRYIAPVVSVVMLVGLVRGYMLETDEERVDLRQLWGKTPREIRIDEAAKRKAEFEAARMVDGVAVGEVEEMTKN